MEPRQAKDLKDVTTEDPASLAACCALLEWSYKHLSNTKLLTCPHSWRSHIPLITDGDDEEDGFTPAGPIATPSLPVVFATFSKDFGRSCCSLHGSAPQLLVFYNCGTFCNWSENHGKTLRAHHLLQDFPSSRWSSEPDELVRSACIRFLAISTQHTLLPRPARTAYIIEFWDQKTRAESSWS